MSQPEPAALWGGGGPPAVCILAGGLGTRLGIRVASVPKPILPVAGRPFLMHSLERVALAGFTRVVICVGYLGNQIEQTIGYSRFGLAIEYSYDSPGQDGTLGAIRRASHLLGSRFIVLYGDTLLSLDYRQLVRDWDQSGTMATMAVLHNENRWGPSNVAVEGGMVARHSKVPVPADMGWIDYGVGGLRVAALELVQSTERDLSALYGVLAGAGQLRAFPVSERFYEIGTPEALAETEAILSERNRKRA